MGAAVASTPRAGPQSLFSEVKDVDDFIGVYREDYNIDEVTSLFEWGSFEELLEDTRVIFKGKELTIKRQDDHFQVIITQSEFIENLERVKLARGRLQGPEQPFGRKQSSAAWQAASNGWPVRADLKLAPQLACAAAARRLRFRT